jgi:subtilisin family serine protease
VLRLPRAPRRDGTASAVPSRRLALRAIVLAAVVAAALSCAGSSRAAAARHDRLPCGLVDIVDELLHCPRPQPQPPAEPPAQDGSPAGSSGTATLAERPARTTSPVARYVADRLLVEFRRGISAERERAVLTDAGADAIDRIDALDVVVAHVEPSNRDAALARLDDSPEVAGVEKDAVLEAVAVTPNDTDWSQQWGLRRVGFPSAWPDGAGGGPIVVAVLDTGVDAAHPDLRGAVLPGVSLIGPVGDDNGHGTAAAGIIAARTDNREGIAGVCPMCSILPVKVLAADGTGDTALVAAGIVRAVDAGARVVSMSLGGPADDRTLDQAVSYALGKNVVVVAAAGNLGSTSPFYPAAIPGVVGVAGTDESDHLYSWSNRGSWVQVAAPGCNAAPALAGGYELFCGTSSATPLVAGLLALRLAAHPEAGAAAAVDALERGATSIGDVVRFGRVDAAAVLDRARATTPTTTAPAASVAPTRLFAVKGRLTPRIWSVSYSRAMDPGFVSASLTFAGATRLELSIRTRSGAVVAHLRGASPLRLTQRLPSGTFAVVVSARNVRARFGLVVTSTPAPAGRAGQ